MQPENTNTPQQGEDAELTRKAREVGNRIAEAISSNSSVYYPGSDDYKRGIAHLFPWTLQDSACVVEPGTVEDLAKIIKIIAETRTPFAIKGGGVNSNPGFSATQGIQISLSRFNEIAYHETINDSTAHGTVSVGASLKWIDVYSAPELIKRGVNVAGARVDFVGVGGMTLAGGYSWKTGQVGMTSDTVLEYEVVLPDGQVVLATKDHHPDLFFALKGGLNKFGIVTKFRFKAFPQTDVFGGSILYGPDQVPTYIDAITKFWNANNDPRVEAMMTHFYIVPAQQLMVNCTLFYDGPTAPNSATGSETIFEPFVSIPHRNNTLAKKTIAEMVTGGGDAVTRTPRCISEAIAIKRLSPNILKEVNQQLQHWGKDAISNKRSVTLIGAIVEPIHPHAWSNAVPSAFPHDPTHERFPIFFSVAWQNPADDNYVFDTVKSIAASIREVATKEGQDILGDKDVKYPGSSSFWSSSEEIYGESLPRLRDVKKRYDPEDVMGLAGGYNL